MQRLTYLATRDELTGHLNRNSLRAELTQTIEKARTEDRTCAFLVASIDRVAMINDGYGFDAGDEVIVGSEGTFGIVTKVWCRITKNPAAYRTLLGVFENV